MFNMYYCITYIQLYYSINLQREQQIGASGKLKELCYWCFDISPSRQLLNKHTQLNLPHPHIDLIPLLDNMSFGYLWVKQMQTALPKMFHIELYEYRQKTASTSYKTCTWSCFKWPMVLGGIWGRLLYSQCTQCSFYNHFIYVVNLKWIVPQAKS